MAASTQAEPAVRGNDAMRSLLETATQEVFRLMVGTALDSAKDLPWRGTEFTAMVGLAGEWCGVLSVRCGQDSANRIAALMLDLPSAKAAEHAWDALGEVANMIAGNYKNKLSSKSDRCMLSLPTVITGADYSFRSPTVESAIVLRLAFEQMPLTVRLELHGEP
jgi:chemotaxis protein CheX